MALLINMRRRFAEWTRPKPLGRRGEIAAVRFLRKLGYIVIATSDRHLLGELDMVAVDGRTIVFVEVKTRRSHDKGHPAEAVDANKQRQLTRLALAFLRRHDLLEHAARFDVVAITWPKEQRKPTIEHFQNAFEPTGKGQMFS